MGHILVYHRMTHFIQYPEEQIKMYNIKGTTKEMATVIINRKSLGCQINI
jgi:hypothetical protein